MNRVTNGMDVALVVAVVGLGIVHGVLPDHGWPIAVTYALEHRRKWFRGTIAALVLGVGHLVSSVALVLAYFWITGFAEFADGPWLKPIAGGLLIALGIYEYRYGGHGTHGHHHGDDHEDGEHAHHADGHDHHHGDGHSHHSEDEQHPRERAHRHADHDDRRTDGGQHDDDHEAGIVSRIGAIVPGGSHQHLSEEHAENGLVTLGVVALALGFAHEEPVQVVAICAGTEFCLELMLVYSAAVIVAILVPTLLLIAGYQHHREWIETYTPYLPALTAAVLVLVGSWFVVTGLEADAVAGLF